MSCLGICLSVQSQRDNNAVGKMESMSMWPTLNKELYCGGSPRQSGPVSWPSEEQSVYAWEGSWDHANQTRNIATLK